jgi:hypothetical protein
MTMTKEYVQLLDTGLNYLSADLLFRILLRDFVGQLR